MRRPSIRAGFTLVEVIVVMAIISILVGAMIPFIYRVWESAEIDTTRQRMSDLKKAMVGDPKLVQNGIRTNFAFVGDNGQLPNTVTNPDIGGQRTISNVLISPSPAFFPNWNGPYMPGGYDPSNYKKDAWGRHIIYNVTKIAGGRRVEASLMSAGPDGAIGTSDDIVDADLQITEREVTPTDRIQGNLNVTAYNATASTANRAFSAVLTATYAGFSTLTSGCIDLGSAQIESGKSAAIVKYFDQIMPEKLPIGRSIFKVRLFHNSGTCTGLYEDIDAASIFVPDSVNAIAGNMHINYTIQP